MFMHAVRVLLLQAAGNMLWALAHMGAAHLPPPVWNALLPVVTRGGRSHPEHLRQVFQVRMSDTAVTEHCMQWSSYSQGCSFDRSLTYSAAATCGMLSVDCQSSCTWHQDLPTPCAPGSPAAQHACRRCRSARLQQLSGASTYLIRLML